MPASVASAVSFSFTPCVSFGGHLSPSPADGVSHFKSNHLKKVEMRECIYPSPSLIAAICCSSSLEELVVTSSGVSVLSVCLCIQTAFISTLLYDHGLHVLYDHDYVTTSPDGFMT